MENLNFDNFLIGKEDRLEIISKIFEGRDLYLEEKYNSDILTLKGSYHHHITKNYEEMELYYKMAIELGNTIAMFNLGSYHYHITKNYKEMEKYYKMSIELGGTMAMNKLGDYYHAKKDYEKMNYYYNMAIKLNDSYAMTNLGDYYQLEIKNYKEMEKYYKMAIELKNNAAMNNLGYYHQIVTKNYKEMEKYYLMAIGQNNGRAMTSLIDYYSTHNLNFNFEIIENLNYKIYKISEISKKYLGSKFILFNSKNTVKKIYKKELDENYCKPDFIITTQYKTYNVHSFVLDSEYFHCLISGPFENKRNVKIDVENEKTIEILLEYLYLGEFQWKEMEMEILEELKKICDEYGFLDLLINCKLAIFLKLCK